MKDALGMPAAFWSSMLQDASGLFRAAEHRSNAGSLNSRETWLRLLIKHVAVVDEDGPGTASGMAKIKYEWHRLGMFGRWWSGGRFEVFCFDFPVGLRDQIKKQLPDDSYLLIGATGTVRMAVRTDRALVRSIGLEMPRHNLHGLARHAVHVTEMLATALNVLGMVFEEQTSLDATDQRPSDRKAIEKTLRYLKSLLQGSHPRAQALEQRLMSETNLLFHLTNQDIAASAQADSAAMRTISFLGLIFLPGTLISAIFSTSFFNYSPGDNLDWNVSSKFWIYWAVATPITLLTYLFWQFWSGP